MSTLSTKVILEKKEQQTQEGHEEVGASPSAYSPSSTSNSNSITASTSEATSNITSKNIVRHKYKAQSPPPPVFVNVSKFDTIMGPKWKAPIVIPEYKLIFFTIQKNGCTVWKQLFRKMVGFKDWRTAQHKTMALRLSGLQTLRNFTVADATEMINSPLWTKAIMLRDPKDRFVSSYLDKAIKTNYVRKFCCHKKIDGTKNPLKLQQCVDQSQTLEGFLNITMWCNDGHWLPQSKRTDLKYFPFLNFVGYLETASTDAEVLLRRIGAWEDHGQAGWGISGNESIFQSTSNVKHKTAEEKEDTDSSSTRPKRAQHSNHRLQKYITTPQLEKQIELKYAKDYEIPEFNLTLVRIH